MTDIWDDETGETVEQAQARFATFGDEVDGTDVPSLVFAGYNVWSWGYGDDPKEFTVIDSGDMESLDEWGEEEIRSWGPFRVDLSETVKPIINGPNEALAIVQSRLEAVKSVSLLVDEAIDMLGRFIKQINEHGSYDLEWGEPGDCWERMVNDEDTRDQLHVELSGKIDLPYYAYDNMDEILAAAKKLGVGRHYGDPHCIWCLQGS